MASRLLRIEPVNPLGDCDLDHDCVDVHATLDDGRVYIFEVATPNCVYDWMANEEKWFYAGEPTVFVNRLTLDNIRDALRHLVESDEGRLEIYGTLQTYSN